ncbi:MAG: hypothetical protein LBQ03_00650 [Puniceicoccales bacterium]|nr:hypothetical protein [Puniceicoccales bacterium]
MKLKIGYMVYGLLCCHVNLCGEISDILIQRRFESGRNIVNFSTKTVGIQIYLKDTIYDLQKQNDELCITVWKIRQDGRKRKRDQFNADENWLGSFIGHMLEKEIDHDIFVDGRLTYRRVDDGEVEEGESTESEDFVIPVEDRKSRNVESDLGMDAQNGIQAQEPVIESGLRKGNVLLSRVEPQENLSRSSKFWKFMGKFWTGFIGVGLVGMAINYFGSK